MQFKNPYNYKDLKAKIKELEAELRKSGDNLIKFSLRVQELLEDKHKLHKELRYFKLDKIIPEMEKMNFKEEFIRDCLGFSHQNEKFFDLLENWFLEKDEAKKESLMEDLSNKVAESKKLKEQQKPEGELIVDLPEVNAETLGE